MHIYIYTFIYIHMCACIYESFYKYICAIYMHIFMFTRVRVHHMIVCSECACACVHMITHIPPLVFHSPLKHILGLEMITRPAPVQIGVDGGKQIVGIVCKPHLQGLLMVCSDHEPARVGSMASNRLNLRRGSRHFGNCGKFAVRWAFLETA